ncbi:MAG: trimethylamine methyltransferase family protein [Planctomycetota bacterium]
MRLEVLSAEEITRIDKAARRILECTGVLVPHKQMVKLFAEAGASVDGTEGRVRIPSRLVDECLGSAGKTFTIYGRERGKTAAFGVGQRNYNSIAGEAHWLEANGTRRFARLEDVIVAAKLGEVLPQITIAGAMADPNEVDISYRCVEVAAAQLRTTTKPITLWFYNRASAKFLVELFTAVAGSIEQLARYPLTYAFLEPISPLRFDHNGIDLLFETCKVPLPVSIGPMAQAGLSAPVTLAGTIAQETAEVLAGICVVQLIKSGTPVCFGGICHAFDMKTTQMIFAGPEQGLMAAATTQMGKHYGLPVYTNVGLTDSKCVDAQAGLEISATLLMGALAGSDIFGHLGIAGVDQASSLEMLVFQHEVIEYVERIMRGFKVDDEHLATEVIDRVGPGGSFIDQMHTVGHFRSELWMPTILDRSYWPQWQEAGGIDIADKLPGRVEELLSGYQEKPLDDDLEKEIARVVHDARNFLTQKLL